MNIVTQYSIALLAVLAVTPAANALSIDFRGVEFQTNMPTPASALDDSVKMPSDTSLAVLQQTADTLQRYPQLKVRIVGFTDDRECTVPIECLQLAHRRATLVYEWFLTHGIVSTQIVAVEARGNNDPIDSNELEEGRQRNRRVEVTPVVDPSNVPHAS